ncbi:MAG: chitobiase/beta-hexosaminidase C-terminal domain-containing protein, partial [bacterium]
MKNTKVLILSILFLSLFSNCGLFDSGSSKKSSNYAGLSNSNTDSGGNTNEDNSATAAADPVFSPDGGSFSSSQNVSITTSTPGAVIYYTSTGVDPTCSGLEAQYSTPISVTATETIKAIACKTNLDDSAVVSETYTITTPAGTVVAPTMTPGTGSYTSAQTVSISTPTSGAVIHYALGGTVPTCSTGTPYTTALTVSSNGTVIKAIACKSGVMVDSSVTTATYYLAVATPSINPGQGTYPTTQTVTISAVTPSSVVHYTIGGSTPTCSSGTGVTTAQAVVSVTGTVIKAVGCKSGMVDSNIASATYILSSSTPCTANNFSPSGYTPCSACSSDQYSTG